MLYARPGKRIVTRAIRSGMRREEKQLFPSEDTAVFVNNRKLTRDLSKAVWYEVEKEQAHKYLICHKGWTGKQSNKMDWDRLHMALKKRRKVTKLGLRNDTQDTVG